MSKTHIPAVTTGDLRKARGCAKSLQMSGLHLITPTSEKNQFFRTVISLIKQNINTSDDEIRTYICDHVKPEWFDVNAAAGVWAEVLYNKVIRFRNYLVDSGYRIISTDYPICIDYASDPKYGIVGTDAFSFGIVRDKCDFVLEKDGETHLIKVISSALPYSYRGQSDETRAIYSPELLAIRAGSADEYPEAFSELWSLTSKEDKAGALAPYESAPGKNILSIKFEMDASLAKAELLRCCQIIGKKTACKSCIYSSYCTEHLSPPTMEGLCNSTSTLTEQAARQAEEVRTSNCTLRFTDAQMQVIEHQDGPMSVIAVPGAGKTRVLVERAERMIKSGIPAEEILMISFTLKACNEIEERLKEKLYTLPKIMTFNALGAYILRRYTSPSCVTLLTEGRKFSEIKQVLDNGAPVIRGVSYDGAAGKYGLINMLSGWFEFIDANGVDEFKKEYADKDVENILIVYSMYKEAVKNCITFDEQISKCNELFKLHPEYSKELSGSFRYIMVDEYQDTNEEQAKMLYSIAGWHENLMVVGDDDQAVYNWRGGDRKFLLNFCKDFPNAKKVYMSDNFRSTQQVLQAASKCLDGISNRDEKVFIAHRSGNVKPALLRGCGVKDVPALMKRILAFGYKAGEVAILGRTNKVLEEVSNVLLAGGIKHRPAKQYLIYDNVFLTLYDVLNLKYRGFDDDVSLYRLMRVLGVSDNELQKIWWNKSLHQNLIDAGVISGLKNVMETAAHKNEGVLQKALYRISTMVAYSNLTLSPVEYCKYICKKAFGFTSHPAINSILEAICNDNCTCIFDMYVTMRNMIVFSDTARVEYGIDMDSVNLLTAHDSKGKEFPCVIIVNLEDFDEDDESRRLLFVAMSRAKRDLFLFQSPLSNAPLAGAFNNAVAVYG